MASISVDAAKLKIHRCVLENGTISFQEKKCDKNIHENIRKFSKNNIKPNKNFKSNLTKPKIQKAKEVKYNNFKHISTNDKSTHLISERVKSYNISIQGLKKWGVYKNVYNDKLLHVKYLDENKREEISLRIDFIYPDNKRFSDEELTELVYLVGSQYIDKSIEKKISPKKMNIQDGKGIMATFTKKNDTIKYRYITRGAVFKGEWLIQFLLLSENLNSNSHQYTVNHLFNSIKITK